MSFHGGLLGTIIALIWFSRKQEIPAYTVADLAASVTPIGLGCGRIGNFINGELFGRATDVDWCMVFPGEGLPAAIPPNCMRRRWKDSRCLRYSGGSTAARPHPAPSSGPSLPGMASADSSSSCSVNRISTWGSFLDRSPWARSSQSLWCWSGSSC